MTVGWKPTAVKAGNLLCRFAGLDAVEFHSMARCVQSSNIAYLIGEHTDRTRQVSSIVAGV
jgi:hypothetical protein